jgi:hypothetical protein
MLTPSGKAVCNTSKRIEPTVDGRSTTYERKSTLLKCESEWMQELSNNTQLQSTQSHNWLNVIAPGTNALKWRLYSSTSSATLSLQGENVLQTYFSVKVLTGATRHHIPEDGILHSHCLENLKSDILFCWLKITSLTISHIFVHVCEITLVVNSFMYIILLCCNSIQSL